MRLVLIAIGGAWIVAVVAQLTGNVALLHHHALIGGGAPLWITTPIFPFLHGIDHAIACLASSAALMLVMVAEGYANLWWMLALTAVMVYEVIGRFGQRATMIVGLLLLAQAASILLLA